ncbi:MAG TPA: lasso peptide biosynthesis B2 protein [Candidatus Angelobacter sp.]|nr:lasso peptide biosynthesis B2 protein [Candidatus Angelobacter sp.]
MKKSVLFFQALFGLITYDVVLLAGKFRTTRGLVERWKVGTKRAGNDEFVDQIAHAVNLACVWYPKQVLCLQKASVTTCLMRSYGIRAAMVLGAQKTPFAAHAWVEVNGSAVNERSNVQAKYTVWERC